MLSSSVKHFQSFLLFQTKKNRSLSVVTFLNPFWSLKWLAKAKCKYNKIDIHVSGKDTQFQSEVTKINVMSAYTFAKTISNSVVFSGPLPNLTSKDMFTHMFSFNC